MTFVLLVAVAAVLGKVEAATCDVSLTFNEEMRGMSFMSAGLLPRLDCEFEGAFDDSDCWKSSGGTTCDQTLLGLSDAMTETFIVYTGTQQTLKTRRCRVVAAEVGGGMDRSKIQTVYCSSAEGETGSGGCTVSECVPKNVPPVVPSHEPSGWSGTEEDSVSTGEGSVSGAEDSVRGVAGSVGRAEDSVSRPEDSVSRPEDSVSRPEDSVSRPEDSVSRPEDSVSRPEDSVSRPEDSVSRPEDSGSRAEDNGSGKHSTEPEDGASVKRGKGWRRGSKKPSLISRSSAAADAANCRKKRSTLLRLFACR